MFAAMSGGGLIAVVHEKQSVRSLILIIIWICGNIRTDYYEEIHGYIIGLSVLIKNSKQFLHENNRKYFVQNVA